MILHRPSEQEKKHLAVLISSSKLSGVHQEDSVCGERKKAFCGWTPVRPSAAYIVPSTPFATKKKKTATTETIEPTSNRHVTFDSTLTDNDFSYMNGHLNNDYSYAYNSGLTSDSATVAAHPPSFKYFPTQTRSTIELEPVVQYRYPDPSTQVDISRIVSMQLKPEVLVEQLLIENRLRTMSLAAMPMLNLEGVGVNSDKSTKKSDSAPLLRKSTQQSIKKRRSKLQTPLEWCRLNTGVDKSPQLEQKRANQVQPAANFSFDNFSYSHQGRQNGLNFRHRLNPDLSTRTNLNPSPSKPVERKSSPQQSIHVVEPMLDRTLAGNGHQGTLKTNSPNTLTTLLKMWKNTPVRY